MSDQKKPEKITKPAQNKLGKVKLALLYVLIASISLSALIAIIGLLVGNEGGVIGKAFNTVFALMLHSLFIIGLIWSDKKDQIGRTVVPTALLGISLASVISSTLGIWGIIGSELSGQIYLFYALVIGLAFVIAGTLRLRLSHVAVNTLVNSTVGTLTVWGLLVTPWIFSIVDSFAPLYYRGVGALSILASTLFIVTIILRLIVTSQSEKLKAEARVAKMQSPSGLIVAYYIVVGIIVSFTWVAALSSFVNDSTRNDYQQRSEDPEYQRGVDLPERRNDSRNYYR